jgi:hypothetical protein
MKPSPTYQETIAVTETTTRRWKMLRALITGQNTSEVAAVELDRMLLGVM